MASPLSRAQQPMDYAFLTGFTCHQNHNGRSLPGAVKRKPVSIPTGGAQRQDSFLEGALTKAGLLSAKR